MISTTPIWAALIAWIFLKERVARRTWFAILMVIVGIVIIGQVSKSGVSSIEGDLLGLLAAATLAAQFSLIRQMKGRDVLPALSLGGIFIALLTAGFMDPLATSDRDLMFLILMGAIMLPIANGLLFLGPKYLPAPEVGLVILLETVLGPIWVWLALYENPGIYSILGGSIVLLTLATNMLLSLRTDQKPIAKDD